MKPLTLFLLALTFASQGWGQVQMDRINVKGVNNVAYASSSYSIASAISLACNGTAFGKVIISPGNYSGGFTPVSNCEIDGSGIGTTVIQAANSQNATFISISGLSNVTLKNLTVDGGCVRSGTSCTGNSNTFDLIAITNSSNVVIDGLELRNGLGNGVNVASGNSQVDIRNSIADRIGAALPAVGGQGFSAGTLTSAAGNSHVHFVNNWSHDNNIGFGLFPQAGASNITSDITYERNRASANANDGFQVFSANSAFAPLRGVRFTNNDSWCNGWPANGTGFSSNCIAGILQTGSSASSSGVGIDINSPVVDRPQAIGNIAHDNFFEGLDLTSQTNTTVNTSGTTVTWVSGDDFNTAWKANQAVRINGSNFLIASISGAETTLTLTTSAGTHNGVALIGVGYSRGTVIGNTSYFNGHGNGNTSGHGFTDIGYGDTWSGNVAYLNNGAGFIDILSSFITHTGDKALTNDRSSAFNAGFICQGCLNPTYKAVTTDDSIATNLQGIAINLDTQVNNADIDSESTCTYTGCGINATFISDNGTNDVIQAGQNRRGPLCFNTGGSYCLTGGASGGVFNITLPATSTALAGLGTTQAFTANQSISGAFTFTLGSTTVGSLPSAASNPGAMILVTDSTAVASEGQTCVGSSTNKALAVSTGSQWKCF